MPRVPGRGRVIAVVLVMLVVVLVGADLVLRAWAERWLAGRLQEELALSSRPDIDLDGFPFFPRVVGGRLPQVTLDAEGLESSGLRLDRVRLELLGVRFSAGGLLAGGDETIRAERGRGSVELTDESLTVFIQGLGKPVVVEFLGPKIRVSITAVQGGQEATATAEAPLHLEEGALVFRPRRVEVEGAFGIPAAALVFRAPLPEVVGEVRYERLRVEEGVARIEFSLRDAVVRLIPPAEG